MQLLRTHPPGQSISVKVAPRPSHTWARAGLTHMSRPGVQTSGTHTPSGLQKVTPEQSRSRAHRVGAASVGASITVTSGELTSECDASGCATSLGDTSLGDTSLGDTSLGDTSGDVSAGDASTVGVGEVPFAEQAIEERARSAARAGRFMRVGPSEGGGV
ncbi:MAG: hypothetical protein U0326_24805 [Polyangiales bacterium]